MFPESRELPTGLLIAVLGDIVLVVIVNEDFHGTLATISQTVLTASLMQRAKNYFFTFLCIVFPMSQPQFLLTPSL